METSTRRPPLFLDRWDSPPADSFPAAASVRRLSPPVCRPPAIAYRLFVPDEDAKRDQLHEHGDPWEELADYNEASSRAHEEGWFYADED